MADSNGRCQQTSEYLGLTGDTYNPRKRKCDSATSNQTGTKCAVEDGFSWWTCLMLGMPHEKSQPHTRPVQNSAQTVPVQNSAHILPHEKSQPRSVQNNSHTVPIQNSQDC
ncbi:hypothetical protein Bbelb_119790 [Branchiostoma belcheri]|nr:hypothetical protein Bbelb_119790 [Branchiostoma belcheri]